MVDIWLPYGGTEVCARILSGNLRGIVKIEGTAGLKDPVDEVRRSINNPIGPVRLNDVLRPEGGVALALNIPNAEIAKSVLSIIMEEASQLGLESGKLTVLLADNPFDPRAHNLTKQLKDELSTLGVNVMEHNSAEGGVYIDEIEGGIKVYLNKVFAETKARISISVFEPNPYTIYNCGEVGVALGLSGAETVRGILAPALNSEEAGGVILRSSIMVSRAAGLGFSINILRGPRGEIIRCIAGGPEEAFQESLKAADSIYRVTLDRRADLVIISPGGAPFDDDILSACGSLENALRILRGNGVVVLVAECSRGYGNLNVHRVIRRFDGDLSALEESLKDKFSVGGFIAYRLLRAFKRANIVMVSAIPDYYASEIAGLKIFRSANEAIEYALNEIGRGADIIAVLNGNLAILGVKETDGANNSQKM